MAILFRAPRLITAWGNLPWDDFVDPTSQLEVSRTGHLERVQPADPAEVMDYLQCARGATDGIYGWLSSDPRKDAPQVYDEALKHWNMMMQLVAWRAGGYQRLPPVALPQSSDQVLNALSVTLENAPDLRRKVQAPFDGLDLSGLQSDGTRLTFIRKMGLGTGLLTDSLDRVNAWLSQSIAQRLKPINDQAVPVVKETTWLYDALLPLRNLFSGAAQKGVETRDKIAQALGHKGGQGQGTPSAGTPPGTPSPGATGTTGSTDAAAHGGPPAPATGTPAAPPAPGNTTTGYGPATPKKPGG